VRGPRRVSLLRAKGWRLPSGASAATSPGNGGWEPKLQLRAPCHLDWALFRRGARSVVHPDVEIDEAEWIRLDWALFRRVRKVPHRSLSVHPRHNGDACSAPVGVRCMGS
jgi:hypothetical protein